MDNLFDDLRIEQCDEKPDLSDEKTVYVYLPTVYEDGPDSKEYDYRNLLSSPDISLNRINGITDADEDDDAATVMLSSGSGPPKKNADQIGIASRPKNLGRGNDVNSVGGILSSMPINICNDDDIQSIKLKMATKTESVEYPLIDNDETFNFIYNDYNIGNQMPWTGVDQLNQEPPQPQLQPSPPVKLTPSQPKLTSLPPPPSSSPSPSPPPLPLQPSLSTLQPPMPHQQLAPLDNNCVKSETDSTSIFDINNEVYDSQETDISSVINDHDYLNFEQYIEASNRTIGSTVLKTVKHLLHLCKETEPMHRPHYLVMSLLSLLSHAPESKTKDIKYLKRYLSKTENTIREIRQKFNNSTDTSPALSVTMCPPPDSEEVISESSDNMSVLLSDGHSEPLEYCRPAEIPWLQSPPPAKSEDKQKMMACLEWCEEFGRKVAGESSEMLAKMRCESDVEDATNLNKIQRYYESVRTNFNKLSSKVNKRLSISDTPPPPIVETNGSNTMENVQYIESDKENDEKKPECNVTDDTQLSLFPSKRRKNVVSTDDDAAISDELNLDKYIQRDLSSVEQSSQSNLDVARDETKKALLGISELEWLDSLISSKEISEKPPETDSNTSVPTKSSPTHDFVPRRESVEYSIEASRSTETKSEIKTPIESSHFAEDLEKDLIEKRIDKLLDFTTLQKRASTDGAKPEGQISKEKSHKKRKHTINRSNSISDCSESEAFESDSDSEEMTEEQLLALRNSKFKAFALEESSYSEESESSDIDSLDLSDDSIDSLPKPTGVNEAPNKSKDQSDRESNGIENKNETNNGLNLCNENGNENEKLPDVSIHPNLERSHNSVVEKQKIDHNIEGSSEAIQSDSITVTINESDDATEQSETEKKCASETSSGKSSFSLPSLPPIPALRLDKSLTSVDKSSTTASPENNKLKETEDSEFVDTSMFKPVKRKSISELDNFSSAKKPRRMTPNSTSDDTICVSSESDEDLEEIISEEPEDKSPKTKRHHGLMREDQLADETKTAQREESDRVKQLEKKGEMLARLSKQHIAVGSDESSLLLDYDSKKKVRISVHPDIASKLKPHQVDGVKFMYDTCYGGIDYIDKFSGSGCILAHCMGLGKTMQLIALLHTVIRVPQLKTKRVLVICPKTTIMNWHHEVQRWLGNIRDPLSLKVFYFPETSDKNEKISILTEWFNSGLPNYRKSGLLLMGYEQFRTIVLETPAGRKKSQSPNEMDKYKKQAEKYLVNPGPDLVICDEGHVIKNKKSATNMAVSKIKTKRRIILTGTPIQNNLKEYYCMVNFIKPCFLGTEKEFSNLYSTPIKNGQHKDSTKTEIKIMKQRSYVLHKKLSKFVQRREASILKDFLQEKYEYVLSIPMTEVQERLYQYFLEHNYRKEALGGKSLIPDYTCLRKIWTHPKVLENAWQNAIMIKEKKDLRMRKESDDEDPDDDLDSQIGSLSVLNDWWRPHIKNEILQSLDPSNKLKVIFEILKMCQQNKEKCLIFSAFVAVLDVVEFFMKYISDNEDLSRHFGVNGLPVTWQTDKDYYRLDGKTSKMYRQQMIDEFNKPQNTRTRVFLISARAGGQGINLIGANRAIILDTSWNPSNDQQNIFRIYRMGQTKKCYIYRLLAMGTMEEKIYSRSVTKQAMSFRVVDEQQIDRHYSMAELSELYTFNKCDFSKRPVPVLPADSLLAGLLRNFPNLIYTYHNHDSLLENKPEQDLSEEDKKEAWQAYEKDVTMQRTGGIDPLANILGNFDMGSLRNPVENPMHFGYGMPSLNSMRPPYGTGFSLPNSIAGVQSFYNYINETMPPDQPWNYFNQMIANYGYPPPSTSRGNAPGSIGPPGGSTSAYLSNLAASVVNASANSFLGQLPPPPGPPGRVINPVSDTMRTHHLNQLSNMVNMGLYPAQPPPMGGIPSTIASMMPPLPSPTVMNHDMSLLDAAFSSLTNIPYGKQLGSAASTSLNVAPPHPYLPPVFNSGIPTTTSPQIPMTMSSFNSNLSPASTNKLPVDLAKQRTTIQTAISTPTTRISNTPSPSLSMISNQSSASSLSSASSRLSSSTSPALQSWVRPNNTTVKVVPVASKSPMRLPQVMQASQPVTFPSVMASGAAQALISPPVLSSIGTPLPMPAPAPVHTSASVSASASASVLALALKSTSSSVSAPPSTSTLKLTSVSALASVSAPVPAPAQAQTLPPVPAPVLPPPPPPPTVVTSKQPSIPTSVITKSPLAVRKSVPNAQMPLAVRNIASMLAAASPPPTSKPVINNSRTISVTTGVASPLLPISATATTVTIPTTQAISLPLTTSAINKLTSSKTIPVKTSATMTPVKQPIIGTAVKSPHLNTSSPQKVTTNASLKKIAPAAVATTSAATKAQTSSQSSLKTYKTSNMGIVYPPTEVNKLGMGSNTTLTPVINSVAVPRNTSAVYSVPTQKLPVLHPIVKDLKTFTSTDKMTTLLRRPFSYQPLPGGPVVNVNQSSPTPVTKVSNKITVSASTVASAGADVGTGTGMGTGMSTKSTLFPQPPPMVSLTKSPPDLSATRTQMNPVMLPLTGKKLRPIYRTGANKPNTQVSTPGSTRAGTVVHNSATVTKPNTTSSSLVLVSSNKNHQTRGPNPAMPSLNKDIINSVSTISQRVPSVSNTKNQNNQIGAKRRADQSLPILDLTKNETLSITPVKRTRRLSEIQVNTAIDKQSIIQSSLKKISHFKGVTITPKDTGTTPKKDKLVEIVELD